MSDRGRPTRPTRSTRPARLADRLRRDQRGQDLVELVIVLPVLLLIVFGVLEFGHMIDIRHGLSGLMREGANIASRGEPIADVLQITMDNGASYDLASRGGSVVSELRIEDGEPIVRDQVASSGFASRSVMGVVGDTADVLTAVPLSEGTRFYVVEVFYAYRALTPLSTIAGGLVPDTIYDRAIF